MLFVTNFKQIGTVSNNNNPKDISESYSITDETFVIFMTDIDFGPSLRYLISDKLQLYIDLGANFSIMFSENFKTGKSINYLGIGTYSALALQLNLGKATEDTRMYLDFGINSVVNIISNQEGNYSYDYYNQRNAYEDTGRWDLISAAAYIHFGWKLDLKRRSRL